MNKRMKKKTSNCKALTTKERVKNQQVTLHQLFIQIDNLEKENIELNKTVANLSDIIMAKEELITQKDQSIKAMCMNSADKIRDLEELVEFHKKDATTANASYGAQIKETERIYHMYEVERDRANDLLMDKNQAEDVAIYWKKQMDHYKNLYHQCINKSWWKRVLNIG
ncbi:hypothetical protein [Niameybacter massiliensis]|uniref:hypothetical protein n=1 Tax=Niameybacter massiliensis TaxID=1658108 RepID=UPI0006B5B6B7|nr:hypothetical protein [Niameybacter massiliensis]